MIPECSPFKLLQLTKQPQACNERILVIQVIVCCYYCCCCCYCSQLILWKKKNVTRVAIIVTGRKVMPHPLIPHPLIIIYSATPINHYIYSATPINHYNYY